MKTVCPNCETDKHLYHCTYCSACHTHAEVKPATLHKLLGIKMIAGMQMIVPLTKITFRKGRTILSRETTT